MKIKIKNIILLGIMSLVLFPLYGQKGHGGTPPSLEKIQMFDRDNNVTVSSQKFRHSTYNLPYVDNERIYEEYRSCEGCEDNTFYGLGLDVDIDLKEMAHLTEDDKGRKTWLLEVVSPSSYGLQFYFDEFNIPKKGKLFFYNSDKTMVLGAFTHENNPEQRAESKYDFGTQWISGDTIYIEYTEPEDAEYSGILSINRVVHVFIDVFWNSNDEHFRGPYGNADFPCAINMACYSDLNLGPNILEEHSKTVAIALVEVDVPGDYEDFLYGLFSGSLINNTNEDLAPLFITAAHAMEGGSFNEAIYLFHHKTTTCDGDGNDVPYENPPSTNSIYGASEVASVSKFEGDIAILMLTTNWEELKPYRVCYNGWNIEDSGGDLETVSCISHPAGDVMKIAYSTEEVTTVGLNETGHIEGNDYWKIIYSGGIHIPGSSGGPGYNNGGLLVGINSHRLEETTCDVAPNEGELSSGGINGWGKLATVYANEEGIRDAINPIASEVTVTEMVCIAPDEDDPGQGGSWSILNGNGEGFGYYVTSPPNDNGGGGGQGGCGTLGGSGVNGYIRATLPNDFQRALGRHVSTSGDYVAATAPLVNKVYVYRIEDCDWVEEDILFGDGTSGEEFGYSVALDGNTVVVGARGAVNAIYFFEKNGNQWVQTAKIIEPSSNSDFGFSVDISEGSAIIGAPFAADGRGRVYFYTKKTGQWALDYQWTSPDEEIQRLGYDVSIYGGRAIAGAPNYYLPNDAFAERRSGITFFEKTSSNPSWLYDGGSSLDDTFQEGIGGIVEMSEEFAGTDRLYHGVYIYKKVGNTWEYELVGTEFTEDIINEIAIYENNMLLTNAAQGGWGQYYTYDPDNDDWNYQITFTPQYHIQSGAFGISADFDKYMVIGSPELKEDCTYSGSVYIYNQASFNPAFNEPLVVCNQNFPSGTYGIQQAGSIQLGGGFCLGADYAAGANITYEAVNEVKLSPTVDGLTISNGSEFVARIQDCYFGMVEDFEDESMLVQPDDDVAQKIDLTNEFAHERTNSIDEHEIDVSIYPNPVKKSKQLSVVSNKKEIHGYRVVSMQGSIVESKEMNASLGTSLQLEVYNYPNGIYTIILYFDDATISKSFVVED